MKRYLTRGAAGVAAAALLVSPLLVTATAANADPGDGTLLVSIVDQYGRPTAGIAQAYAAGGSPSTSTLPTGGSTVTLTLPPDAYGLAVITPWSGYTCEGLAPCGIAATPVVTPVVTVTSGSTSTYTAHVTVPSITGGTKVGSPLTLQIPAGLSTLQGLLLGVGLGGTQQQQWVRGTTDVPGATGSSYTTTFADGSQAMTARLLPAGAMGLLFSTYGVPVTSFSTNAIKMGKAAKFKTTTTVSVPKRLKVNERATAKIKVKAKHTKADPDGFVTLVIGKFRTRSKLKDGSVFINLPNLSAGTYTIITQYAGSEEFAKSKGKRTTITVGR